ncbi:MAG: sporulation protein YunB [Lachnospiraceae bacterium]|nr:sporulation protein YunB [Lachnospiraceae bacterium]
MILVFIIFLTVFAVLVFNNRILPKAIEISRLEAQNVSNMCINTAVMKVIEETGVSASDFFGSANSDVKGFSVNTVLVNKLCSKISVELNEEIKSINDRKIKIPIGAASDMGIFNNIGPDIGFKLLEHGTSYVDYETSFEEAGINQTNFKIWLNVSVNVKIVNPLVSKDINVQRKIMLVDTVIKGDIPEGYLSISR